MVRVQDTEEAEDRIRRHPRACLSAAPTSYGTVTGNSCTHVETQATHCEAPGMLTVDHELLCRTLDQSDCRLMRALPGIGTHLNALDTALCMPPPAVHPADLGSLTLGVDCLTLSPPFEPCITQSSRAFLSKALCTCNLRSARS